LIADATDNISLLDELSAAVRCVHPDPERSDWQSIVCRSGPRSR
jgi:hypothetical protein